MWVALVYGLLARVGLAQRGKPRPVLLREALERLGGAWVKFGQALARRFDLLGPDYCRELSKLLDDMPHFSYERVQRIVTEELGRPPDQVFRWFDRRPFAAASLGQVHLAVTHQGTRAAVKVQRPGVASMVSADLRLLGVVTRLIDMLHLIGATETHRLLGEFRRWIGEELDYRIEAQHSSWLSANARGDPWERNARAFTGLTTERVLTSEFLPGVPLSTMLGDEREPGGGDPVKNQVAVMLIWNFLNQVYVQGLFHADLHPGNILLLPDGGLGYVDFGIVARIDDELRRSLGTYAFELWNGNSDSATGELMRWVTVSGRSSETAARRQIERALDRFARTYGQKGVRQSDFEQQLLTIVRTNHLAVSPDIALYMKTLSQIDALMAELAPTVDLAEVMGRFLRKARAAEITERLSLPNVVQRVDRLLDGAEASLTAWEGLAREPQELLEAADRASRRVIAFAAAGAVAAGLAIYLHSQVSRQEIHIPGNRRGLLVIALAVLFVAFTLVLLREGQKLRRFTQSVVPPGWRPAPRKGGGR